MHRHVCFSDFTASSQQQSVFTQVATELGDKIKVLKIDTDENPELSTSLQVPMS